MTLTNGEWVYQSQVCAFVRRPVSFVPLYEKIKERIRADILTPPEPNANRRLPTERELEALYRVSRPTISKALAALAAEGLLTKEQGRGSFARLPASAASAAV